MDGAQHRGLTSPAEPRRLQENTFGMAGRTQSRCNSKRFLATHIYSSQKACLKFLFVRPMITSTMASILRIPMETPSRQIRPTEIEPPPLASAFPILALASNALIPNANDFTATKSRGNNPDLAHDGTGIGNTCNSTIMTQEVYPTVRRNSHEMLWLGARRIVGTVRRDKP